MDTSLKGAYLCSKHGIPHFAPEGGTIVHTSSVTGIVGFRNPAAHTAAMAALVGRSGHCWRIPSGRRG